MTPCVAVLGANGFIGSRLVEQFVLSGVSDVRPVVRSVPSLVRARRFSLDARIADGTDPTNLRRAFEGCDVVVHAVAGAEDVILGTLSPVYEAAQEAGVRRIVYISTASVHGQAPAPGTDESSPLSTRQPIAYNTAKVKAERRLLRLREDGDVELVMLRPGIVYGPRSQWVGGFANSLLNGTAALVKGASGICNGIYVDNLVHAIRLALTADGVDRHSFLVGDEEQYTWAELYRPIAEALGFDLDGLPDAEIADDTRSSSQRLASFRDSALVQAMLPAFPHRLRDAVFAGLAAGLAPSQSLPKTTAPNRPTATLETALLHRCAYKLPHAKASRMLGYTPPVSFTEASRRSVGWLAFAGYPTVSREGEDG